jgi:hypothetical protein
MTVGLGPGMVREKAKEALPDQIRIPRVMSLAYYCRPMSVSVANAGRV